MNIYYFLLETFYVCIINCLIILFSGLVLQATACNAGAFYQHIAGTDVF